MAEHLSDLVLDEVRLGQAPAEAGSHVQACPECSARLSAIRGEEAMLEDPRAARILHRMTARAVPSERPWWSWVLPAAAVAAAGVVIVLLPPHEPAGHEARAK